MGLGMILAFVDVVLCFVLACLVFVPPPTPTCLPARFFRPFALSPPFVRDTYLPDAYLTPPHPHTRTAPPQPKKKWVINPKKTLGIERRLNPLYTNTNCGGGGKEFGKKKK